MAGVIPAHGAVKETVMVKAGLIGESLRHSLSPQIHEKYGRLIGTDIHYDLLETPPEGLAGLLDRLEADGYMGVNVTIPYKKAVMPYLHTLSPQAQAIGAVNTIRFENGRRTGHNTDYFGMKSLLERHNISLAGQRVAVLGSGGAARCAYFLAKDEGASEVFTISRHPKAADTELNTVSYDALAHLDHIGVLINATPVGMHPHTDACPVPDTVINKCGAVVDTIYNPAETQLLKKAAALNLPHANGLWMLCAQALAAQAVWTGRPFTMDECAAVHEFVLRSNIVLIGMPGSGKSTVGRLLSDRLGLSFVDTDAMVEATHGSIPVIFAAKGEAIFRGYELSAAREAASLVRVVLSTGGGIVQTEQAMLALRESGIIVYVDRPLETLLMETETEGRPLLADGRSALIALYEKRYQLYRGYADIIVENTADAQSCAENIIKKLEAYRQ
jgi:shikimate dehydrogenase